MAVKLMLIPRPLLEYYWGGACLGLVIPDPFPRRIVGRRRHPRPLATAATAT